MSFCPPSVIHSAPPAAQPSPSTQPSPAAAWGHTASVTPWEDSDSHCSGILDYACMCACQDQRGALVLVTQFPPAVSRGLCFLEAGGSRRKLTSLVWPCLVVRGQWDPVGGCLQGNRGVLLRGGGEAKRGVCSVRSDMSLLRGPELHGQNSAAQDHARDRLCVCFH